VEERDQNREVGAKLKEESSSLSTSEITLVYQETEPASVDGLLPPLHPISFRILLRPVYLLH
jgi:hypothetical protein